MHEPRTLRSRLADPWHPCLASWWCCLGSLHLPMRQGGRCRRAGMGDVQPPTWGSGPLSPFPPHHLVRVRKVLSIPLPTQGFKLCSSPHLKTNFCRRLTGIQSQVLRVAPVSVTVEKPSRCGERRCSPKWSRQGGRAAWHHQGWVADPGAGPCPVSCVLCAPPQALGLNSLPEGRCRQWV